MLSRPIRTQARRSLANGSGSMSSFSGTHCGIRTAPALLWTLKKQRRLQQQAASLHVKPQEITPELPPAKVPPPDDGAATKPQKKKKTKKEGGDEDRGGEDVGSEDKTVKAKKRRKLKDGSDGKDGKEGRVGADEDAEKDRGEKETSKGSFRTSSLFKHNPEIPDIKRSSVSQLKEEVFSSSSFEDLDLHPHLVATLNKVLNVSTMTSVQQRTVPVLLSGRDAVVRSQTGSGKTLSYAVPLVQSLQARQPKVHRSHGPLALILVPTRELALQTFQTLQKLLKPFMWIVPGVLMGGEKKKAEKARLRKGVNILVATPGRLVDHIKNTLSLAFSALCWLVLDEADRTLDLGFEKDLTVILNSLNSSGSKRQNVLLSATISQGVTRLVDVCLNDPVTIQSSSAAPVQSESSSSAAVQSESFTVPEGLKQFVVIVPSKVRLVCLAALILDKCQVNQNKMVVFVSSCEVVEFLHRLLSFVLNKPSANQTLSFLRLHGNMKQEERVEVFGQFSKARSGVLLCTDVAARGLDLPQVSWIVQFTAPVSVAEYVHRAGRTARAGHSGHSLLLLAPHESSFIPELNRHRLDPEPLPLTDLLSVLLKDERYQGRGKYHSQSSEKAREQEIRERATVLQTEFENFVHSDPERLSAAKRALQCFLRAYTSYPSHLKHIFHIRHLHLGHSAKSFGLRDAPRGLGEATRSSKTGKRPEKRQDKRTGKPQPWKKNQKESGAKKKRWSGSHRDSDLLRSEFSSGLQPKTKKNRSKTQEEPGPGES
ncbi:probable ATP-dependent RNA helicase DDX31 [Boleophthalmus pectinirostris]|uniref:probable ATP-dependent RNA helicase DDX31 n=1 Tax=Boleophthalmus pectinirostris TaxID=150288 RepID=UPI00242E45C1|nr:probable ATP-dependent RNA helicase DDX31 [Boleophthalmus pectinirostris]